METRGEGLREALAKNRKGQLRWRCPVHLRAEVVSYVAERREGGSTLSELSRELGVSESCLGRWLSAESPRLASVQIVPEAGATVVSAVRGLVLVTPRGYRVEGLDVSSAALLLQRL